MKNKMGVSSLAIHTFHLKEWWKIHKPNWSNIKKQIKYSIDELMELYTNYRFLILFFVWIVMNVVYRDNLFVNSLIVFCAALISVLVKYLNFKEDQFYLTTDFSSAMKDLDALISDCIQEYMLMNDLQNPVYINDVTETKIREEVINLVIAKLSKRLLNKLSIAYNPEVVHKVIAIRVYIIVMRLVIEINKDKETNTTEQQKENASFDLSKYMVYEE